MKIFNKYAWRRKWWAIENFFKPQQRWLTKLIPNSWCDKVELIPRLNFAMLVHFVEHEMGNVSWDWQDEVNNGFITQECADSVKQIEKRIRDTYEYVKETRPKLQKELDDFDTSQTSGPNSISSYFELEKKIEDLDTWALKEIIDFRAALWT